MFGLVRQVHEQELNGAFNLQIYHTGAPGSAGGYGALADAKKPRKGPHLDAWQARGKSKPTSVDSFVSYYN
jgi:hypothetical protein